MFPWNEAMIADLGLRRERLLGEVLDAPCPWRRRWQDRRRARAEARAARTEHELTA